MKTSLARALAFALATGAGCLSTGGSPDPGGSGGAGSDEGGSTGSGGRGGAGAGGRGGSTASGGSSGAGGSTASGGSSGAGGSTASGGSSGAGGGSGGATAPDASASGGSSGAEAGTTTPPVKGEVGAPNFPGWKYIKAVKIDTSAAGVMGDVANFPLPVTLNATNFDFSQAKGQGEDIRFGKADGTPIPYAIEHWDGAGKSAVVWVKIEKITGNSADQSFNIYWGNAGAGDASDGPKVFDTKDGFVGVWHLADDPGSTADGYKDATGNAAHATGVNMDAAGRADARIGRGAKVANAKEQWIKVEGDKMALFDPADGMTASIWGKADSFPGHSGPGGYDTIYSKGESWTIQRFSLGMKFEACFDGGAAGCAVGKTNITTGAWHHFVLVAEGGKSRFYVDGALDGSSGAGTKARPKALAIGNQSQYIGNAKEKRSWDGLLDEARFIKAAKDINWIKLDYESQKDGSKLLGFGETKSR
jgi:hypothetical protein